jgi:quercetin dioxygenase-like cupin family protein
MWSRARNRATGEEVRAHQVRPDLAGVPPGINCQVANAGTADARLFVDTAAGNRHAPPGHWIVDDGKEVLVVGDEAVEQLPEIEATPPPVYEMAPTVETDTPLIRLAEVPPGDRRSVYQFRKGRILPVHAHRPATNHATLVVSGRLECFGRPSIDGLILEPGDCVGWIPGEPHGFRAVEDCEFHQIPWLPG